MERRAGLQVWPTFKSCLPCIRNAELAVDLCNASVVTHCSAMRFVAGRRASGYRHHEPYISPNSTSWGGGGWYDNTSGLYLMWVSEMANNCGMATWTSNSHTCGIEWCSSFNKDWMTRGVICMVAGSARRLGIRWACTCERQFNFQSGRTSRW